MVSVSQSTTSSQEDSNQSSQADKLKGLAKDLPLFRTPGGKFYVQIPVGDHKEVWDVRSRVLKDWLIYQFDAKYDQTPNPNALNAALQLLEAKARFTTEVHEIHLRLAYLDRKLYLDLCNSEWEVVQIDENGWEIIKDAPVKFRRAPGMLPLPKPLRGGSLDELKKFINMDTQEDWVLLVAWLLSTFHPTGPYPILVLQGEQGTGKTSNIRRLRSLSDPNTAVTNKQPKEGGDMHIKAESSWILAFDNMSTMQPWLSDIFCGLSTGSGESTRKLYSDDEQVVFYAKRPCSINGIEEIATAGDIVDRAVTVSLPVIPKEKRRSERELDEAFEEARPRILGALLDVVSSALRNLPNTHLDELPRMADFALWVTAAESELGWEKETFTHAYYKNKSTQEQTLVESSPVASAIYEMLKESTAWSGTAEILLKELPKFIPEDRRDRVQKSSAWPKDSTRMGGALRRNLPALRSMGVTHGYESKGRVHTFVLVKGSAESEGKNAGTAESENQRIPLNQPVEPLKQALDAENARNAENLTITTSLLSEQKREEERVRLGKIAIPAIPACETARDANGKGDTDGNAEDYDDDLEYHPF